MTTSMAMVMAKVTQPRNRPSSASTMAYSPPELGVSVPSSA
ncbi:hypothetical protein [Streptomyces sp. NPDC049915]